MRFPFHPHRGRLFGLLLLLIIVPGTSRANWLDTFEGTAGAGFAPQDQSWSYLAFPGTEYETQNGNTDDQSNGPGGNDDWLEITASSTTVRPSVLGHVTGTNDGSPAAFGDIRVTGWVNFQGPIPGEPSSGSRQGLAARFDGFASVYTLLLDFSTGDLVIAKAVLGNSVIEDTVAAIVDLDARYYLELTALDNPGAAEAKVMGRVWDRPGGTVLASLAFADDAPMNPGTSGVVVDGSSPLGGSFDDVGSRAILTGDMDLDGDTDFDDIGSFVLGLKEASAYETAFGVPPEWKGDTDGDGDHDFDDIPGFVNLLQGQVAFGVPEPPSRLLGIAGAALLVLACGRRRLSVSD